MSFEPPVDPLSVVSPLGRAVLGYRAFGLFLVPDRPIPGLRQALNPGLPELRVHFAAQPPGFDPARYQDLWFESWYEAEPGVPLLRIFATSDVVPSLWLCYQDGTSIVIDESSQTLWVDWAPASCFEESLTYLFGPVMALLAQLRGVTCLHGSAVAIDGVAIAMIGSQGAGKSTSAAAFARAGFPVVADDIILLREGVRADRADEPEDRFSIEPTYPIVRLWPSSVELLFGSPEALPLLSPQWEKRALNATEGNFRFQEQVLPLAAVYVLQPRSDAGPLIEPVSFQPALMELVANSWAHYANKPAIVARQFTVLSRLASSVPVRYAAAHANPTRLDEFCRLLCEDVGRLCR